MPPTASTLITTVAKRAARGVVVFMMWKSVCEQPKEMGLENAPLYICCRILIVFHKLVAFKAYFEGVRHSWTLSSGNIRSTPHDMAFRK